MITTFIGVGGCVQSIHTVHAISLCMLLQHGVPMHQEPANTTLHESQYAEEGVFIIAPAFLSFIHSEKESHRKQTHSWLTENIRSEKTWAFAKGRLNHVPLADFWFDCSTCD